jgi:hypothetical protein
MRFLVALGQDLEIVVRPASNKHAKAKTAQLTVTARDDVAARRNNGWGFSGYSTSGTTIHPENVRTRRKKVFGSSFPARGPHLACGQA